MLFDKQTRLQAVDINNSVIIQAPAGSGKTSLLVDRFVNLLKICKDPSECLAITFSKKAAFEMRYRVLEKLEQIVQKDKDNLKLDDLYYQVLDNPNKLQILTIDAFCASITQKMPILSRFGINLKINEFPRKLYQEAVDKLLATIDTSDPVIKLFKYFSNDYELIKKLLVEMLFKREQWLPLLVPIKIADNLSESNNKIFNVRKILENNLQQAVQDILTDILNYLPKKDEQQKIIYLAKVAANNIEDLDNNIVFCKDLTDSWPTADCLNLPIWRGLTDLLLSKDGKPRAVVSSKQGFLAANKSKKIEQKKIANDLKKEMQHLLKNLSEHNKTFLSKLKQVMILPDLQYSFENWDILKSLFFLLPQLVAHLMLVFDEYQEVDFTEVAIAALEAMGTDENPTDLALCLDYKLNHILVDEFQDTSVLQFNLLKKLVANWHQSDGRTVFLVGDPMQSIYRFRQANVSLFLKAQQHGIVNVKLKNLYLKTNFRSSPDIIQSLNQLFCKIFPIENDIIYGGISYTSAVAADYKYINSQQPKTNRKHEIFDGDKDVQFFIAEDSVLEAKKIVELIKHIKKKNPEFSVAILVRVKSHAAKIIKCLKSNNMPYQANEIDGLYNQSVICDLVSLTRAILHPGDIIAWAAVLRSSLVGLKIKDLYALVEGSKSSSFFNKIYDYKKISQLSDDAVCRLNYVLPILFDAINKKETINLSILIKQAWLALGGNLLLSAIDLELAEDYFHKLLKINDIFAIDCIEEIINQYPVESNTTTQTDLLSVQIMTIHKSKGLEFDVVIVPEIDKAPKNSDQPLFLWEERASLLKNYLLFAPIKSSTQIENSIYHFIKKSEDQRELHEAKRLLYVAITRAKKKFYGFSGNLRSDNKSFMNFLEPYIEQDQKILIEANKNDETKSRGANVLAENSSEKSVLLQRIPLKWYIENL